MVDTVEEPVVAPGMILVASAATLKVRGEPVAPGKPVALPEAEARDLIRRGLCALPEDLVLPPRQLRTVHQAE